MGYLEKIASPLKRGLGMKDRIQQRVACKLLNLSEAEFREIVRMDPGAESQRTNDVIRIARALAILMPVQNGPADWMRAPNSAPIYRGRSALALIRSEVHFLAISRQYLEAQLH